MITEDYVSFETAKLLKEKGFDCECSCYYFFNDKEQFEESLTHWDWNNGYTFRYSAPTLQMAMKWLREVHNLHITLPYYIEGLYGFEICDIKKCIIVGRNAEDIKYVEPEEACEVGIKYCLENLVP